MNVNETAILKKLVNGEREPATHTEHAAEKIRPWTQMRDLAQKFGRMSLFLQRITVIGATDNLDISRDEFPFLSFALRGDQRTLHNNRSTSTKSLDVCALAQRIILPAVWQIANRRADD